MSKLIELFKHLIRRAGRTSKDGYTPEALKTIARQVAQTRDVEYACDEVFRLLDQFAEMVARGEDAAKLMPLIQQHLEMCPDCREEFEALMRVLTAPQV